MTPTETTIAATITQVSCTMPTATMMLSTENTASSIRIWNTTGQKPATSAETSRVASCASGSTRWWISTVALPIRNRPPPIRMMSLPERATGPSAMSGRAKAR